MQTINNRMTETQIADLFSLAVQLQVKAEESDDRDTAILAYSIQNACSNLTESRREFRATDATIHNLELKLTDMAVQLANSESKCRELAAELSAVDKIHNEAVFITDEHYEQSPPEVQKMIRSLAVLQIPAYDAFLAEVRAQGVERMIDVKQQQLDGMHPDTFAIGVVRDSIRRDIYELKVFAEILRQEAAQ
ncbi:hypothetical protein ACSLNB_00320 [Citrobacter portucalensis]|uniref:hypothetical protein n=1 Tax=Citrobacter portucalensis TaxID=1639133 RepID=UPI003EDFE1FA